MSRIAISRQRQRDPPYGAVVRQLSGAFVVACGWLAEPCRWAGLLAVGLFLIGPFLDGRWFGGTDLFWYLERMQDFVLQIRAGIFPPMIAQTSVDFSGETYWRGSLYLYLGALTDLVTGHALDGVRLLYMTLATAVLGGLTSMYLCLLSVRPQARWLAMVVAILYVACPAGLTQMYVLQMVPTIMALPFVPVVFAGCVAFVRTGSFRGLIAIAVATMFLVVTHPILTLWLGIFVVVVVLSAALLRWRSVPTFVHLGKAVLLCLGLSVWFLVPLLETGSASYYAPGSAQANTTLGLFRQSIYNAISADSWKILPLHFLPLSVPARDTSQLGFSLWLLLLLGLAAALTRKRTAELVLMLVVAGLCLAYIYPVTIVSNALYRALPAVLEEKGALVPDQRLYIILAALAAFCGFLGAAQLSLPNRWFGRVAAVVVMIAALGWSLEQANLILVFIRAQSRTAAETARLQLPANEGLSPVVPNTYVGYRPPDGFTHSSTERLDPRLDNTIVDEQSNVLVDNLKVVETELRSQPSLPIDVKSPFANGDELRQVPVGDPIEVARFSLEPGKRYLFTYLIDTHGAYGSVIFDGPDIESYTLLEDQAGLQYASLSSSGAQPEQVRVRISMGCEPSTSAESSCLAAVGGFHLQSYDLTDMPIQVSSLLPYRAQVQTGVGGYLETHRIFMSGYQVLVNGLAVQPRSSDGRRLQVPLAVGENLVQLNYVGPPHAALALWVSAITALALLVLSLRCVRVRAPLIRRRPS